LRCFSRTLKLHEDLGESETQFYIHLSFLLPGIVKIAFYLPGGSTERLHQIRKEVHYEE
jgi:hypothetical protein